MDEDFDEHVNRVRRDHYAHWAATVIVIVWAGSIYGWIVGIVTFVGLSVVISLTNMLILFTTGNLSATRFSRWGWLLAVLAAIVISSASIESVPS